MAQGACTAWDADSLPQPHRNRAEDFPRTSNPPMTSSPWMLNFRTFSTIFSMQVLGSVLRWGRGGDRGVRTGVPCNPQGQWCPLYYIPQPPWGCAYRLVPSMDPPRPSQPATSCQPTSRICKQQRSVLGWGEHPTTPSKPKPIPLGNA